MSDRNFHVMSGKFLLDGQLSIGHGAAFAVGEPGSMLAAMVVAPDPMAVAHYLAQLHPDLAEGAVVRPVAVMPQSDVRALERLTDEIESDEQMQRDYIPLPGGWELQTKGNGSTLRLLDKKTGERHPLPLPDFVIAFIERMAREVHTAARRPV